MIRQFLTSLLAGVLASVVCLAAVNISPDGSSAESAGYAGALGSLFHWAYDNLHGSLPLFLGVLVAFLISLERMRQALLAAHSIETIANQEHWVDLWISLFFGIGVVWTAIGMRGALLSALGGLDASTASEMGAFAILQRLVDGGILLALSTTIVGGIGGYLLRLFKGVRVGALIRHRYAEDASTSEQAILGRLDSVVVQLRSLRRQGVAKDTQEAAQSNPQKTEAVSSDNDASNQPTGKKPQVKLPDTRKVYSKEQASSFEWPTQAQPPEPAKAVNEETLKERLQAQASGLSSSLTGVTPTAS